MVLILQIFIEKTKELNGERIIKLIDYSKAFGNLILDHLFITMTSMGFLKHTIHFLQALYKGQQAISRWNKENYQPIPTQKGALQRSILSLHLFSLYREETMRESEIENLAINI